MVSSIQNQDLGEGTSSGKSYNNASLTTAKAFTISSLKFLNWSEAKKFTTDQVPYVAINLPAPKPILKSSIPTPSTPVPQPGPTSTPIQSASKPSPFFPPIDPAVSWPGNYSIGKGLQNLGNTCFLNSTLQVLVHTPPLVRYISSGAHNHSNCVQMQLKKFCMICTMKELMEASYKKEGGRSIAPRIVTNHIRQIASRMKPGRQEDSHEFLRFCVDAMQLASIAGKPKNLDNKIKESTFIHQIFGGRLRSRVTCGVCKHSSDTFDSMLDLSLDINRADSIKDALATFVKIDDLKGNNKYKCEKCKKLVNAQKNFTIHQNPIILTIHLKRFTPTGKKLTDTIKYPESLNLSPYMSDRSISPNYKLFGVINHIGGGPHSGHYTANVKAPNGSWYHMDDSSVTSSSAAPLNARSAYVLFYCREQGDGLKGIIAAAAKGGNGVGMEGVEMGSGKKGGKRSRNSLENTGGEPAKKKINGNGYGSPMASPKGPPIVITASPSSTSAPNPFIAVPRPPTPPLSNNPFPPSSIVSTTSTNSFYGNASSTGKAKANPPKNGLFQSKSGNGGRIGPIPVKRVGAMKKVNGMKPRMLKSN